jgi:hypothetical protein
LVNIESGLVAVPVGMSTKASISPLSDLAGEAQPVGHADRPYIHRPSWEICQRRAIAEALMLVLLTMGATFCSNRVALLAVGEALTQQP